MSKEEFEKIFTKLTSTQDPTRIFDEFLDYCIDINLFTTKEQGLDFKGREEQYFEMFQEWIKITHDELEKPDSIGWFDYLGNFYESVIQSKFKAGNIGQFFTPSNVCEVMAQLTYACNKNRDGMINDACCGSGRLLLAGHKLDNGAIVIGQDLDIVSVKMCALNFYIHGVRGSVLHMNSITNEFFGGFKVNQYLGFGLPLPHIELLHSYDDAFHFFGQGVKEGVEDVVDGVPVKAGGTVQTTLI